MGRSWVASLVALPLALSCAPQQPAAAPQDESNGVPTEQKEEARIAPLPALKSVAAPEGVVVRFRVLDPKKFTDGVLDAASIPFDLEKAVRSLDGDLSFLEAMDMTGPIEGAVVLNPQEPLNPSRFISVGVMGVDHVLRTLESSQISVQEGPGGVFHFELGRDPCAVGRSMGKSPARVVCSDRRGGLHQILPYALRGFPNETLAPVDIYAQVDLRPIRHRYKKELDRLRLLASVFARQAHVGHPKLDRALTDAAIGLADELSRLANEAEQITIEVNEQGGDVETTLRATFDGQASTTVQNLVAQSKLMDKAPAAFSNLPSTAASGLYMRELPAGSIDAWMSIIVDLVSGYVEYKGASSEFSTRLSRVVRFLGPWGRTHVEASGPIVSSLEQGRPVARAAWSVWGVDQPKAQVEAFFDDLGWVLGSPDWDKVLEAEGRGGTLKRVNKRIPHAASATVYEWKVSDAAVADLNESLQGSAAQSQGKKPAEMLSRGYLAVHQIDDITYVSWVAGTNIAPIAEAYAALSSEDVERLGQISRHRPIMDETAVAAGFATLSGAGSELWSFAPGHIVKDLTGLLDATPHHGLVPCSMAYRVSGSKKVVAEYSLSVPREFTQDAATLAAIVFTELNLE